MKKQSQNPIDKDKVSDRPNLLPYAHHVGSAIIKPIDQGKVKGRAMKAMAEQTQSQLEQIKDQVELLIEQAQKIHNRIELSEKIYGAEYGFEPVIGNNYYLYKKGDDKFNLSLIAPDEWKKVKKTYVATVKLLADHTWEILNQAK